MVQFAPRMLTWIVLSVVVVAGVQAPNPQGGEARAQAEQLARSGSYRAALERFQAIAAQNPDDIEARIWIARLYRSLGDNGRAVDVYQSILATKADHPEALLGLGDTLIATGRLREAAETLKRAESLAPENAAVLASQGRLHAAAGRTELSLAYYGRSLALQPGADSVRREYDEVRARRAHRVEVGYQFEHFNTDIPNPQAVFGTVNGRLSESLRVSGTVQYQRRFSRNEARGGAGVEWMVNRNLRVNGGALFSGDAQILPDVDGYGGIAYTAGRATWSFDLRVAQFDGADVNVGTGGLRLALPRNAAAWIRYSRFDTDYELQTSDDIVHAWVLGASGRVNREWTLGAEYTRGPDQLEMLTVDRIGPFEANTMSGFAEFFINPLTSFAARYDYQARPDEVRVHRAGVRLIHRF
jgi:YaiO family outer membrane protein